MNEMTQCWTVEATETGDNAPGVGECPQFRWVFVQREDAKHVVNVGKKVMPNMRWSCTVTPFGDVEHALHDIKYLKDFEDTKEDGFNSEEEV